jgi:hypothetical protein
MGRPDKALDYLERMLRTFSFAAPGTMYEVSPDYGMFVQAWNLYSFTQPVVAQFFGIHPNAYEKKVSIGVQMPSTWQQASLEDVMVGNNTLSIRFEIAERGPKSKCAFYKARLANYFFAY